MSDFTEAFRAQVGESGVPYLAPVTSWRQIADIFAGEPGAHNARGDLKRGYVTGRIVETSGAKKPHPFATGEQYGVGRRAAQRYITERGTERRRQDIPPGPGDPVFERVRAEAEASRREQLGITDEPTEDIRRDLMQNGGYITIKGTLVCSPKSRKYPGGDARERTIGPVWIEADQWETILYAWDSGNERQAEQVFNEEFAIAYLLPPQAEATWSDIDSISLG